MSSSPSNSAPTPAVALLSPCGWGNLGDVAIMDSVIQAVRRRLPEAPIIGLTLNPADTAARHSIPAFTCTGFSRPYYGVTVGVPHAMPGESIPVSTSNGARSWRSKLRQYPLARTGFTILSTAKVVPAEIRHRRLLAEATSRLRYLVVAGGGQLDDFWGGALGHPYVLWRWMRRAKQVGAAGLFLSVGTGSLDTPLARYFVKEALSLAKYRSFRDEGSRDLVGAALVQSDPVVPDLAYGLPVESMFRLGSPPTGRRTIGLSPIAFCDPDNWPVSDAVRHRSYLAALTDLACRLLEAGYDLVLYGTDSPDARTVEALRREVVARRPDDVKRVRTPPVNSLADLFEVLSGVQMVIASRLHGVLLAHLLGIPTGAISYERKVATLMRSMGHQAYCLSIDDFNPQEAFNAFDHLFERREAVAADARKSVSQFRRKVDDQYDAALGPSGEDR